MSDDPPTQSARMEEMAARIVDLDRRVSLSEAAFSACVGYIIHELPDHPKVLDGLIEKLRVARALSPPTPEQMNDPGIVMGWQNRLAHLEGLFEQLRIWGLQQTVRPTGTPPKGGTAH